MAGHASGVVQGHGLVGIPDRARHPIDVGVVASVAGEVLGQVPGMYALVELGLNPEGNLRVAFDALQCLFTLSRGMRIIHITLAVTCLAGHAGVIGLLELEGVKQGIRQLFHVHAGAWRKKQGLLGVTGDTFPVPGAHHHLCLGVFWGRAQGLLASRR